MRGITSWSYTPYKPFDRVEQAELPYLCRIAPYAAHVDVQYFDSCDGGAHTLLYRPRGESIWQEQCFSGPQLRVTGLQNGGSYELCVRRESDGVCGEVRLARCGAIEGVVTNYLHPEDTVYDFSGRSLCSPSLLVLPSGKILVSMDVFASLQPQNLTIVMESTDGGKSFSYLCELFPCFWGKLFYHRGKVYMFSTSTEYGDLLIGVSQDEGRSFSPPVRLFPGGCSKFATGCHKAPMPVIEHGGRLWTGVDYRAQEGGHANGFASVPAEADLLDPANWSFSPVLHWDNAWEGMSQGESGGLLEGNAVIGRDGELYNLLRYNCSKCTPSHDRAVLLHGFLREPERRPEFSRVIDFAGGSNSKFDVLYDAPSGQYISVASVILEGAPPNARNALGLCASPDLSAFTLRKLLIDRHTEDPKMTGYQYVSIAVQGEDLYYLSRTARNEPRNFHDANYQTFHVLQDFRKYL